MWCRLHASAERLLLYDIAFKGQHSHSTMSEKHSKDSDERHCRNKWRQPRHPSPGTERTCGYVCVSCDLGGIVRSSPAKKRYSTKR